MKTEIEERLETWIDQLGLQSVLEEIAQICREKAAHVESNWQDPNTAKQWNRAGERIEAVAGFKDIENVS